MDGMQNQDGVSERNPLDSLPDMAEGANKSAQIFVSLFLILIAFFMVLNSISNQQVAKADAVMESVHTTFKKRYAPKVEVIDLLARKKLDSHSDEFYEEVQGIFAGLIDFPGQFAAPGGKVLEAEFPAAVLFSSNEANIRADQTRFINALADILKRSEDDEQRAVEIVVAAPPSALTDERPWNNIHILRAAAFARELEDRGVSGASVSAGLMTDERDLVRLVFTTSWRDSRGDGA